jgi:hypothetical protein
MSVLHPDHDEIVKPEKRAVRDIILIYLFAFKVCVNQSQPAKNLSAEGIRIPTCLPMASEQSDIYLASSVDTALSFGMRLLYILSSVFKSLFFRPDVCP